MNAKVEEEVKAEMEAEVTKTEDGKNGDKETEEGEEDEEDKEEWLLFAFNKDTEIDTLVWVDGL